MESNKFKRKYKEEMPVLAICYDFDKTLTPDDMQAQGYIQSVNYEVEQFWKESNERAQENDMDQNLAYMYMMVKEARGNFVFNRKALMEYGEKVKLYKGVETWFKRIKEYGKDNGVIVEHYIISSGLKEMIEGTKIKSEFEKIYASAFYYDDQGVAIWPAQAINYTNKTQFLFRISKGVLDVNDQGVNDHFDEDKIRVPFRNIVYIGDSDTDIPCMKLVNTYGGYSIGVYDPDTADTTKVHRMIADDRIRFYAKADYSEGSELDKLVKFIIDRTKTNEIIENEAYKCQNEARDAIAKINEEDKKATEKDSKISALRNSSSFANTHTIINELNKYKQWSNNEKESLFIIACENSQVKSILKDTDVAQFFRSLLEGLNNKSENAKSVEKILNSD